jgi:hypothetical protein
MKGDSGRWLRGEREMVLRKVGGVQWSSGTRQSATTLLHRKAVIRRQDLR